mgnify:CR=1 FL=1
MFGVFLKHWVETEVVQMSVILSLVMTVVNIVFDIVM